MVCELYLNKAVTQKKSQTYRNLRSLLCARTSGASLWPQLWFWPTGLYSLAIWSPLFILPGRNSCHFPSLSPCLRSCLSQNCGAGLWCWVRSGPWPEAPRQVLAQTPARRSLLSLGGLIHIIANVDLLWNFPSQWKGVFCLEKLHFSLICTKLPYSLNMRCSVQ